jgi:hypothetical protein
MFPFGEPFDSNDWNFYTALTADTVMRAWEMLVEGAEPWAVMPPDDRAGYVRVLVSELLDFADGIDVRDRRCRLDRVARRHGAYRRAQGCAESTLKLDFIAMRQALRDALRESGATPSTVREATRCLLPDWQLAHRAAHVGFFDA